LEFSYGPHGKPELSGITGGRGLCFNLSHAQEYIVYAVTNRRLIGIDIAYMHDLDGAVQTARRFFSVREWLALRRLPVNEQRAAFFACWSRKEAFVKAIGKGLAMPLDSFDVSLGPDEPARLVNVVGDPEAAERWSLWDLPSIPGYASALAVEGHSCEVTCWQWQDKNSEHRVIQGSAPDKCGATALDNLSSRELKS
jgi:4'-phosphopantetheinyl transferase